MHHAIRMTAALAAMLGTMAIAQAEGGPGDSGVGAPDGSASAVSAHKSMSSKKSAGKGMKHASKRANAAPDAASGAKADGPMSNAAVGKGG